MPTRRSGSGRRERHQSAERKIRQQFLRFWWAYCPVCDRRLTQPHQVAFTQTHSTSEYRVWPGVPLTSRDQTPAAYIMNAMREHGGPDGCGAARVVGGDLAKELPPDGVERIERRALGIE